MESLDRRAAKDELFINEVIFAELSVRSDSQRKLERALDIFRVKLDRTSTEALYLAGKIFGRYRSSGVRMIERTRASRSIQARSSGEPTTVSW